MVFSEYVPDCGVSIVELRQGENLFEGIVYLHDEDKDVASSYAGCMFAEIKATIQAYKYRCREAKKVLKTMENMYQQLTQLREFSYEKHSRSLRHIRKQIKIQQKLVNNYKNVYEDLQEAYPEMVEDRLNAARTLPDALKNRSKMREFQESQTELNEDNSCKFPF